MRTTYRITLPGQTIDTSVAPSPLLLLVFPAWNGEPTEGRDNAIYVTFTSPQTPADLGPLVKVEELPSN
jgi:hypothetical protein